MPVYIGDDVVACEIDIPYLGIDAVAREVDACYLGVDGVAREVFCGDNGIGSLEVGSSVYMDVEGVSTEFLVVHQGLPMINHAGSSVTDYDDSCDGTWLLMKEPYVILGLNVDQDGWGDYLGGEYPETIFHNTILPCFVEALDPAIIDIVKTVKIPHWIDTDSPAEASYSCNEYGLTTQAFLLSVGEVGADGEGRYQEGMTLDYFKEASDSDRIMYHGGTAYWWYTRTAGSINSPYSTLIGTDGVAAEFMIGMITMGMVSEVGVRPALILPSDTAIDENFNIIA